MSVREACGGPGIGRLLDIVRTLRGENGCPWDRRQTCETLKPYLVEECYELLDAIDSGDLDRHRDELGDVLLQVVLQSQIREDEGAFAFDDVADRLADKLVHRHPHVFGETEVADADEVLTNWEKRKRDEREAGGKETSVLEGVPRHLPALHRSERVQSRAARVGFDWDNRRDVAAKIHEELAECEEAMAEGDAEAVKAELGDLLFSVVNLARFHGVNAEEALDQTVTKFTRRFQEIERRVASAGREMSDCSLSELDDHWEDVKREERAARA